MYLLDTNVLSELRPRARRRPDAAVLNWASSINAEEAYVSAVTIMEPEAGILRLELRDAIQGAHLRSWLDEIISEGLLERVLSYDAKTALVCAGLHVPRTRPERDAMIAATALVHDLTVVTRNERDFAGAGVRVLNPWKRGEAEPG